MATQSSHNNQTPTPWQIGVSTIVTASIWDSRERLLAILGGVQTSAQENKANAAFIVRACNNHEALVESLSLLVSFDDRQGMADHIREQSGNNEDAQTPEQAIYLHGISAARKALAALTATQ